MICSASGLTAKGRGFYTSPSLHAGFPEFCHFVTRLRPLKNLHCQKNLFQTMPVRGGVGVEPDRLHRCIGAGIGKLLRLLPYYGTSVSANRAI